MTYQLDLDILPLEFKAKIQVRISIRSAVRLVTDRQTHDVKTITPDASQTWGVIMYKFKRVCLAIPPRQNELNY